MLATLRRLRWFPLLALCLSPGGAGIVLPAMSPCPMEAPWLVHDHTGAIGDHAGSIQHPDQASHSCHCIGQCCPSTLATMSSAAMPAIRVAQPGPTHPGWQPIWSAPVRLPADHLPPATAPPLLG